MPSFLFRRRFTRHLIKKYSDFKLARHQAYFGRGAENYVNELAKHWTKAGHRVTIFCGNDGHSPRNEIIDGVEIIRRGGFYFVYFWAFLYYWLQFGENTIA